MRFQILLPLVVFITTVVAWTTEDQEIFKVNHELKKDLGDDVTFYSWLGLENGPKSSYEEINKAYRKLSRKIHPDKVKRNKFKTEKQFKRAKKVYTERYQRLSVVGEILRSRLKERYDFFYNNGFPKYKNNSWLYEKFRPSVLTVFVGLYLVIGVFQYFALKLQNKQAKARLENMIYQIKRQAWPQGIPPVDGLDRKLNNPQNGQTFVIKSNGGVYVEDAETKTLQKVDPEESIDPGFQDTIIFKLPIFFWNITMGNLSSKLYYVPAERLSSKAKKEMKQVEKVKKEEKKKKKAKTLGEKVTLPNGKVVYGRKKNN